MTKAPLFLAPLRIEAAALRRGAGRQNVMVIGMGPGRAGAAALLTERRVESGRPIVLAGIGGALVDGLAAGDIVVGTSVSRLGEQESVLLSRGEDLAAKLRDNGLIVKTGPIVCSEKILKGDEDRASAARTGALVVEMEAFSCLRLAASHPFGVVRVVVDVPGREVFSLSTPSAMAKAYAALRATGRALRSWIPNNIEENPLLEVGDQ